MDKVRFAKRNKRGYATSIGYDFDFKTADIIKGVDEWLISQWEE